MIIPFTGSDRLPQLQCVMSSLWGQMCSSFEIIVVEESATVPLAADYIRKPATYIFLKRSPEAAYNKARMLNAGVVAAKGKHIVLHDADVLVPHSYLDEIRAILDNKWEAVCPLRYLFCLDQSESHKVQSFLSIGAVNTVADVMANFPGGSVAIRRGVFERLGGMDERFKGWGGEDTEFLRRMRTVHAFRGAFLPGLHLWHPSAANKLSGDRNHALLKTSAPRNCLPPGDDKAS